MKKIFTLLLVSLFIYPAFSQEVNKSARKKFSIGFDLVSDMWQNLPDKVDARTINKGANIFGMYNYRFGKSSFSFAIGVGIGSHNLYSNCTVAGNNDSTWFVPVPDSIKFKKSKLSLTYADLPFEFRLKTKKKFRFAIGFKAGLLIGQHTKYKGDNFNGLAGEVKIKSDYVPHLEKFRYGPTVRIGYKWFNLTAYYQLSEIFKPDQGPQIYPVSVGLTLMPF